MTQVVERLGVVHPDKAALVASGAWLPAALPIPSPTRGIADLIASARVVTGETDDGVRWTQGFTVVGDDCGEATAADPCDATPPTITPHGQSHYEVLPYLLVAVYECSTFGAKPDEIQAGARRILDSGAASAGIERQLWEGDTLIAANPSIRSEGTDFGAGVMGPPQALAELEMVARDLAPGLGRYMIHASPRLVSLWHTGGALEKVGNTIQTILGTVVVAGGGYRTRATGPGGVTLNPPQEWAVITGLVTVHLGPVMEDPDANLVVDRTTNTIAATAARFAAASWPPCLAPQGVKVDASV